MPNLVEQQEARRRERREEEREQQRREERLEALREQAREEERERLREEELRQAALDQARAYAAEEERRRARHERAVAGARQDRRARAVEEQRQLGRLAASREAARAVRRALARQEQAADERGLARRADRRQEGRERQRAEGRARERAEGRVEQARRSRREEQAQADRATATREERAATARDQRAAAARSDGTRKARRGDAAARRRAEQGAARAQAQRGEGRRDARLQQDRVARREAGRSDRRRSESQAQARDERRTQALASARAQARADGSRAERMAARRDLDRARQRAQERTTALGRQAATQQRLDRTAAVVAAAAGSSSAPPALRVHGPLLLDASDVPVRLRGVELPVLSLPRPGQDDVLPVPEAQLDELARWGATALALPVGLDDLLSPPAAPTDPLLLPEGAVEVPLDQGEPDEDLLGALEAHVAAVAARGMVTILQLGPLRGSSDDRLVDLAALRLFWGTLAARLEQQPGVVYDVLPGPTSALHPVQFRLLGLALAAEVRRACPGAVVVLESPDGEAPAPEVDLPGVVYGVRVGGSVPAATMVAVTARARTAPVLVLGLGDGAGVPPQSAAGRRLAAVGAHWLAAGWPQPGWADVPGRLRPSAAGRSVESALAAPDRPAGTTRDGNPADVGTPVALAGGGTAGHPAPATGGPGGGGGGGGPGLFGAPRLLAQLLLGAVPGGAAPLTPPLPASRYLPTRESLVALMASGTRAERGAAVAAVRDLVAVRHAACAASGLLDVLRRVRAAEIRARTSMPAVPPELDGVAASQVVPTYLRERLLVDGAATTGTQLVEGTRTPAAVATSAASAASAVLSLRQLDDVLGRVLAASRAAAATGAAVPLVLALHRTEGALGMPPSWDTVRRGIPSGTSTETTSLAQSADVSHLVWVANAAAVATPEGAGSLAIAAFVLQLAGLDVVEGRTWADYEQWTLRTWAAVGPSSPADAAARRAVLQTGVDGERRPAPGVVGSDAWVVALTDPVTFTATVLGDGVQLLRGNRAVASLFGIGPLPAGAPTELSLGLAYLRYNAGDDNARRLLASALVAASSTGLARWAGLRARIGPTTAAAVATAVAAGEKAAAGVADRKDAARIQSEAVWPVLRPWCEEAGNLEALEDFVNRAGTGEWPSGWFAVRANVARFRSLLHYYEVLFHP